MRTESCGRAARVVAVALSISLTSALTSMQVNAQPTQAESPQPSAPADQPQKTLTAQEIFQAKKAAKKLADEGEKRFASGDFAGAYDFFAQADERFHAPTFVVRQARSKAKLSALIESRDLYERVINEVLPKGAPLAFRKAKEEAEKELEALKARIPTIKIVLKNAKGARVTIDGTEVPAASLSDPIAQNPGAHTIAVAVQDGRSISKPVELAEGKHESVELELPEPPPPPPPPKVEPILTVKPPPLSPTKPKPIPEPAPDSYKYVKIAGFSVGGAALAVGLVTGAIWMNKDKALRNECIDGRCPLSRLPDIQTTKTIGRVAAASLILGGIGLGMGTAMVMLESKHRSSEKKTLSIRPSLNGVTLTSAF